MLIIGGGPGGYTAALYAARAGFDTLVTEKLSAGGQMALTRQIDNYPGFVEGIGGWELVGRGVAYCAACDGMFYKGKTVVVVGGGNTAAADTATNIPCVYAVGDVRTKLLRQVVTAVADGAMAVHMAEEFLA